MVFRTRAIEAFSGRLWTLLRPEMYFSRGCRQFSIGPVCSVMIKSLSKISDELWEKIGDCRALFLYSYSPIRPGEPFASLLEKFSFSVEKSAITTQKRQKNRRFPPRRLHALFSFHLHDRSLMRQLYPVLYEALEPRLCRLSVDTTFYDEFDLDVTANRVRCADIFIPLLTSSYQNCANQLVRTQFKTALECLPKKGPYWILPLVMNPNLEGDFLNVVQTFPTLFLFEQPLDLKKLKKEFSSLIHMIFETRQVFR
ncbi:hypothetical protein [Candidatus Similichlamydia epinepheli]|uniref:hypothetical protein n=1 Tax=Candidatus Similichlamydia epinepheli TaxID=1903953 RepID=UPI000D34CD2A|nr:hypothetical protein [Candidatus Similichlamydia epinepheli]